MRALLRFTVLLLAFGLSAAAALGFYVYMAFFATGPEARGGATETVVLLEPGLSVASIASLLEREGVITDKLVFRAGIVASGRGRDLKAGEYAIPSRTSMAGVMQILIAGKSIMHRLTVAEGLTSAMVMRLIKDNPVLLGDLPDTPQEGSLLPETYLFLRGTTRAALVARMRADHDRLLEELWQGRAPDLPFSTKEEAVTLASIVEKETGIAAERPRVAAVFINRLRKGMRLQSDPTIIYGLTKGEPLGRGIRQSELDRQTPYNTYQIDGLPPTPIANPGRAALEAVLNPLKSNDLYFVADGTGGHVFASTLGEHERNVATWRRIERERAAQN